MALGTTLQTMLRGAHVALSSLRTPATPSIGAALKLASALGVPVESLFGSAPDTDSVTIVHGALSARNSAAASKIATGTSPNHRMLAFVLRPAAAKARNHPMSHHEGEEILFVLSGSIALQLAGQKEFLQAGDCAHFDSTIPHKVTSLSGRDAKVLIVIAPQEKTRAKKKI